jgi:hypothetical protein
MEQPDEILHERNTILQYRENHDNNLASEQINELQKATLLLRSRGLFQAGKKLPQAYA